MQRRSFLASVMAFLGAPLVVFGVNRTSTGTRISLPAEGEFVRINGESMQVGNQLIRIYAPSGRMGYAVWDDRIQAFLIVGLMLDQESMSFYTEPCQSPTVIK